MMKVLSHTDNINLFQTLERTLRHYSNNISLIRVVVVIVVLFVSASVVVKWGGRTGYPTQKHFTLLLADEWKNKVGKRK